MIQQLLLEILQNKINKNKLKKVGKIVNQEEHKEQKNQEEDI